MFRRHHALVALSCLSILGLVSGCSDDEKATPQAIFQGSLTRGAGTDCADSAQMFSVGEFGTPALKESSKPKKDGDAEGQGTVSIACSVTSAGNGEFNVDATLGLSGATGGTFHVAGKFGASGTQTGINAAFASRETGNRYEQNDGGCTVTYDTAYQGIALGRVWGRIDCPHADLSGGDKSCSATATFRFENCNQ
jgi:hypothetical protein